MDEIRMWFDGDPDAVVDRARDIGIYDAALAEIDDMAESGDPALQALALRVSVGMVERAIRELLTEPPRQTIAGRRRGRRG